MQSSIFHLDIFEIFFNEHIIKIKKHHKSAFQEEKITFCRKKSNKKTTIIII